MVQADSASLTKRSAPRLAEVQFDVSFVFNTTTGEMHLLALGSYLSEEADGLIRQHNQATKKKEFDLN